MMLRRQRLLLLVCNLCQAELPIAFGENSHGITPEIANQQFACLGWKTKGNVSLCPKHSGLSVLTVAEVWADFMNFMKRTGRVAVPHPKDQPADWAGSTIFGRKRPK